MRAQREALRFMSIQPLTKMFGVRSAARESLLTNSARETGQQRAKSVTHNLNYSLKES